MRAEALEQECAVCSTEPLTFGAQCLSRDWAPVEKEPLARRPWETLGPEPPITSLTLQGPHLCGEAGNGSKERGYWNGSKTALRTDELLICTENPEKSTKKLLDFVNLARLADRLIEKNQLCLYTLRINNRT